MSDNDNSSFFDELAYGWEKSTWLGGDVYRFLANKGDKETLAALEEDRIKNIEASYRNLTEEDKQSGWALTGEIGGLLLDPSAVALGALGAPSKIAKLGKLANRGIQATSTGAVASGDYAIRELAAGREVDPVIFTASALAGGAVGALIPPGVGKKVKETKTEDIIIPQTKAVDDVVEETPTIHKPLEKEEQDSLDFLIDEWHSSKKESLDETLGTINNARKIMLANRIQLKYKEQKQLRRKGGPKDSFKYLKPEDKLADADFLKLESLVEKSKDFKKQIPSMLAEQAENISKDVEGVAGKLKIAGQLSKNTIAQAVYRPLIGSLGGLGTGAAYSAYSDEEFNPLTWMVAGAGAGIASKMVMNLNMDKAITNEAQGVIDKFLRSSFGTQFRALFSGSAAAKAHVFGGELSTLSKNLFSQRGASLKGAASLSVEESKNVVLQDFSLKLKNSIKDTNIFSIKGQQKRDELFNAAYMKANNFWDDAYLTTNFNKNEIDIINNLSNTSLKVVSDLTKRAESSGIKFKMLEDYGLPQIHNVTNIVKDVDKARSVYREAFLMQKKSQLKAEELTEDQITKFTAQIDEWLGNMISTGVPSTAPRSAFEKSKKAGQELYTAMRPLTDHFEKDRLFRDKEARKLLAENGFFVSDVNHLLNKYLHNTINITEFARRFGAGGEGVQALKKSIRDKYNNLRETSPDIGALATKEKRELSVVNDMVNGYFGLIDADSAIASNSAASGLTSLFVTAANIAYLPKVTLTSLAELAQPLVNNQSLVSSLKGFGRAMASKKDFGKETGFSEMSSLEEEMRQYALEIANPNSTLQTGLRRTNERFFKLILLPQFTDFSRRYAYNAGIEDTFKVAKKIGKKRTTALQNLANSLGLTDDYIKQLNNFKTVDEAFASTEGRKILNIGGLKSADRDVLIPTMGNRRAFAQSRDPFYRALGQFLSWSQAKTTQTNALITRLEDGDHKLFAKGLGALALYNGHRVFLDWANDPTGEWLEEDEESYLDTYLTLETLGRSVQHSGNYNNFVIDKVARLFSSGAFSSPSSEVIPALGFLDDAYKDVGGISRNLMYGDYEGALKQGMDTLIPFGSEIKDISEGFGIYDFEDKPNKPGRLSRVLADPAFLARKRAEQENREGKDKGGVVEDVPRTAEEPDERIDKMTGLPYDKQAGEAFVDASDSFRRSGVDEELVSLNYKG